jgi:hypothetical protein
MLILIPSLLCSAYSNFSIDDLPTILNTISSELIRIFSATSSHNAHLLHTLCTHAIFIVVLAISDKHTSMRCVLNICQHVVVADKIKPMEEEKDGPSRAMLRSILLSVLHV